MNWTLLVASYAAVEDRSGSVACSAKGAASALSCRGNSILFVLAASTGASFASAVVFFISMVRKYRTSLYEPYNWARQAADGWDDETMQYHITTITARHPDRWPKEQVRAFIAENWARWAREQPPWFVDPLWRASLQAWALPDDGAMQASKAAEAAAVIN